MKNKRNIVLLSLIVLIGSILAYSIASEFKGKNIFNQSSNDPISEIAVNDSITEEISLESETIDTISPTPEITPTPELSTELVSPTPTKKVVNTQTVGNSNTTTTVKTTSKPVNTTSVSTTPAYDGNVSTKPASELDGMLSSFKQGSVGDCGAVSAIEAIDNSSYGKQLMHSLITINSNGTYTLNFGAGKQTVSKSEVDGAYISGDLDARVIEAGLQKAINVYNGCFSYQCFEVITGYSGNTLRGDTSKASMMSRMEDKCKSGEGIIAACDFTLADSSKNILGDGSHSYSIKTVNQDTVIVVNPWDTSKDISLSRSWFESAIRYMTHINQDTKKVDIFWS